MLNYSFLNYEVLVTAAVTVTTDTTLAEEQTALIGDANYLTIATYNLENMDPSDNKYTILANDIVYSLRAPDILAVQEVQDADGAGSGTDLSGVSNVQGLIDAIFAQSGLVYTYVEIAPDVANTTGGEPGGNIRNGYLYQADRVTLVSGSLALLTDRRIQRQPQAAGRDLAVPGRGSDHDQRPLHLARRQRSAVGRDPAAGQCRRRLRAPRRPPQSGPISTPIWRPIRRSIT